MCEEFFDAPRTSKDAGAALCRAGVQGRKHVSLASQLWAPGQARGAFFFDHQKMPDWLHQKSNMQQPLQIIAGAVVVVEFINRF